MKVKLTLSVDEEVLRKAKEYALKNNKTLSELFEESIKEKLVEDEILKISKELGLYVRVTSFRDVSESSPMNKGKLLAGEVVREMRDERLS